MTSLRLQETEQQDAQECVDARAERTDHADSASCSSTCSRTSFKARPSPVRRPSRSSPISSVSAKECAAEQRQFQGDMRYRTVCKSCGHSSERKDVYTELTINLAVRGRLPDGADRQPNCWLDKQLDASLATEDLKGANKYECGNCEKMRDATRYTELVSIPPVGIEEGPGSPDARRSCTSRSCGSSTTPRPRTGRRATRSSTSAASSTCPSGSHLRLKTRASACCTT